MAHRVRRRRLVAPFPHSCAAAAACEGSESGTRPFERGAECGECGGIDEDAFAGPVCLLVEQGGSDTPYEGVGAYFSAVGGSCELYCAERVPE